MTETNDFLAFAATVSLVIATSVIVHETIHAVLAAAIDGAALAQMTLSLVGTAVVLHTGVALSPLNAALTPALTAALALGVVVVAKHVADPPVRFGLVASGYAAACFYLAYGFGLVGRGPYSDAINAADALGVWAFAPEVVVTVAVAFTLGSSIGRVVYGTATVVGR